MMTSHSTDKLNALTRAATDILRSTPELGKRITSFSLTWEETYGVVVPIVNITFADEPKPPLEPVLHPPVHDPLFRHTQTVHD